MKKAFDANVSRARPRLRLGSMLAEVGGEASVSTEVVESLAAQVLAEPVAQDLSMAVKARLQARERPSAAEALQGALRAHDARFTTGAAAAPVAVVAAPTATVAQPVETASMERPQMPQSAVVTETQPSMTQQTVATMAQPVAKTMPQSVVSRLLHQATAQQTAPAVVETVSAPAPEMPSTQARHVTAVTEAPPALVEVQTTPPPAPVLEQAVAPPDAAERRERLKERLKSVRENPRPEPLPETVAEAGVLAVERIAALQSELTKARAMNLALAQDLEAARRTAERATEEARVRMDEARRLSHEMEGRAQLLTELEKELSALEGERNEALLAVQEARQAMQEQAQAEGTLRADLAQKDAVIEECLAEEERLAGELETAQDTVGSLRRATDALKVERDTLARQVSDLTRERAELLEARKALEAVHRALAQATGR